MTAPVSLLQSLVEQQPDVALYLMLRQDAHPLRMYGLTHAIYAAALAWMLAPSGATRRWLALAAGLVFCAHPLATQSVTYLTQRSTSAAAVTPRRSSSARATNRPCA